MPNYDYFCEDCGHQEEIFQKITAEALRKCPKCSKESFKRRPGGGIGLAFKGDGFYINDYASGKKQPSPESPPDKKGEGGCCPCGKNDSPCSSV